jgi:hypothetical protein
MSNAVVPVELRQPVLEDAAKIAERRGLSVAGWISSTVEELLREERQAAEFYRRRAMGGDSRAMLSILDKAPDGPPVSGDEI